MKTKGLKSIFAALACATFAFALTGCSKSDEEQAKVIRPASILLKLENKAVAAPTRVFDNESTDGKIQDRVDIKDVSVFFCTASGQILHQEHVPAETLADGKLFNNDDITTSVDEVIVISNINATVTLPTTKDRLRGIVKNLADAEKAYHDDSALWGYGSGRVTFAATADLNDAAKVDGTATVTVTPILSRIDVTVDASGVTKGLLTKAQVDAGGTLKGVLLKEVAILNSGMKTRLIPGSGGANTYFAPIMSEMAVLSPGKFMRNGVMPIEGAPWEWSVNKLTSQYEYPAGSGAGGAVETFLHGTATGVWNTAANWDADAKIYTRSFYAIAPPTGTNLEYVYTPTAGGNPVAPVVIATLVGTCYSDEGNYPVYFPVQFSAKEEAITGSEPLTRGKHYRVKLKLVGNFENGGGGVTDPEIVLTKAEVVVTVESAQWEAVVPIEKIFNGGNE